MEDGPPIFSQDITCPDLLDFTVYKVLDTGLSPTMAALSRAFSYLQNSLRAAPRSLAATKGISFDFFSYRYLDVSVPYVCLLSPMYSVQDTTEVVGFPIQKSTGQRLFATSP